MNRSMRQQIHYEECKYVIYWAKEGPLPGRQAQSLVKLCPLAQQARFFKFNGKLIFSIKIRFLLQPQGCIIMQRLVVIIFFFQITISGAQNTRENEC